MKRNTVLLAVISATLLIAIGFATSTAKAAVDTSMIINAENEVRIYQVLGMDCPGCHGSLEKLVKKIEAVSEAKANWEKKLLTVTLHPDAELDDKEVIDAIERANFTLHKRIK
jgi:copper chaperone CopZ